MLTTTDQRKFELALLCLGTALHPNTEDGEVLAAVEAWRRKANGVTLSEVVTSLYDKPTMVGRGLVQYERDWREKFARKDEYISRLTIDNLNLEREVADSRRIVQKLEREKAEIAAAKAAAEAAKAETEAANLAFKELLQPKPKAAAQQPVRDIPKPEPAATKNRQKRADRFDWSADMYRECLRLLQHKKGLPAVIKLSGANRGMVNRKFCNDGPDEVLLSERIIIHDDGRPMTYLELWKIGHRLHNDAWKKTLTKRYNLSRNAIQWDDPTFLDEDQRRELRQEFGRA